MNLSSKKIVFFVFTLFFSKCLFSGGLLPETLVEVGENECVMIKDGGKDQKDEDFAILNKDGVQYKNTPNGIIAVGKTANGENVVSRDFSGKRSGNKLTLEIQHSELDYTKIRN